jgi:heme-degrading monooxygenase HmoA
MPFIARTPEAPYYAVIFTSINAEVDHDEHTQTYRRLVAVAASYDGFLGIEPARNAEGSGVAAIYWKDRESIAAFARDPEHRHCQVQVLGTRKSCIMGRDCRGIETSIRPRFLSTVV